MYRLELKYQNLTIREYRLQDGDIRFIGRAPENHIVIDDPGISRKHCFIIQIGDELLIGDRGSKHMTLVNGVQIVCAKLNHGDSIGIGVDHTLKVSIVAKDSSGTVSAVYDGVKNLMTTT
ncbi:MAG: FHA domain-containing protein [Deltaproteobacteria bacterium]|jgi:pSer/pThr/pTyr-binding forkhead associated (FHA) protein